MTISLSPETQKLLDERMKQGDYKSPDELIRVALETFACESFDDLDPETRAAIDRADAQAQRGEGIRADQAFEQLRKKHLGA